MLNYIKLSAALEVEWFLYNMRVGSVGVKRPLKVCTLRIIVYDSGNQANCIVYVLEFLCLSLSNFLMASTERQAPLMILT